jgi:hypothetical protein
MTVARTPHRKAGTFHDVVAERLSRRGLLKGTIGVSSLPPGYTWQVVNAWECITAASCRARRRRVRCSDSTAFRFPGLIPFR